MTRSPGQSHLNNEANEPSQVGQITSSPLALGLHPYLHRGLALEQLQRHAPEQALRVVREKRETLDGRNTRELEVRSGVSLRWVQKILSSPLKS